VNSVHAFSLESTPSTGGSDDGGVRDTTVWDVAGGRAVLTIKAYESTVSCVAFSPDGRRSQERTK